MTTPWQLTPPAPPAPDARRRRGVRVLSGSTALVTGGSSGVGRAIAIDLAAHLNGSGPDSAGDSLKSAQPAAKGLIVESSFTSLADIARSLTYPWLPLQLLLSQIGRAHV